MNSSAKAGFLAPPFSSSCLLWAIPSAGLSCPLAVSLFIEHYLLSTSWIRQHARDWGCKHEKTWWSLPSVRSQHSGRDRHAHKELQNNTFKAPISMWNYVYFYVFIYSLSVLHLGGWQSWPHVPSSSGWGPQALPGLGHRASGRVAAIPQGLPWAPMWSLGPPGQPGSGRSGTGPRVSERR